MAAAAGGEQPVQRRRLLSRSASLPLEVTQMIATGLSAREIIAWCNTHPALSIICKDEILWLSLFQRDFARHGAILRQHADGTYETYQHAYRRLFIRQKYSVARKLGIFRMQYVWNDSWSELHNLFVVLFAKDYAMWQDTPVFEVEAKVGTHQLRHDKHIVNDVHSAAELASLLTYYTPDLASNASIRNYMPRAYNTLTAAPLTSVWPTGVRALLMRTMQIDIRSPVDYYARSDYIIHPRLIVDLSIVFYLLTPERDIFVPWFWLTFISLGQITGEQIANVMQLAAATQFLL